MRTRIMIRPECGIVPIPKYPLMETRRKESEKQKEAPADHDPLGRKERRRHDEQQ